MNTQRIIEGLIRYIDRTVAPRMNGLQEVGYLTLCELVRENPGVIDAYIKNNFLLKTYLCADGEGNINLDRLYSALEKVMQKKGTLSFDIPLYGAFKIEPSDLRAIYDTIKE